MLPSNLLLHDLNLNILVRVVSVFGSAILSRALTGTLTIVTTKKNLLHYRYLVIGPNYRTGMHGILLYLLLLAHPLSTTLCDCEPVAPIGSAGCPSLFYTYVVPNFQDPM